MATTHSNSKMATQRRGFINEPRLSKTYIFAYAKKNKGTDQLRKLINTFACRCLGLDSESEISGRLQLAPVIEQPGL